MQNGYEKADYGTIRIVPHWVVLLFFWIGLVAATCLRLLALITRYDPDVALWVWRFAMVLYLLFFGYRIWIGDRRRKRIVRLNLIDQVEQATFADPRAQEATRYILFSILRSKEQFNYAFIWGLSLIALLADVIWAFWS